MSRRPRLVLLLATALAALVLVACGGDDSDKASSSTDVNTLLEQTFAKGNPESGQLHLALKLDSAAAGAALGRVSFALNGPFESQGEGKLPKFKIDAAFTGAGRSLKAGATSTGDKGFVSLNGQAYAVSDQVFRQFKAGYEQSLKQGSGSKRQSLASLGIDPRRWLKNPRNAGEAEVGDTDTIKITGDVDVDRMLADVSKATAKTRALGVPGLENLPSQLTPAQRRRAAKAIKKASVAIYVGEDDLIMRRLHLPVVLNTQSGGTANFDLDLSYTDVNESQDIEAPSNPKPFDELVSQLQSLAQQAGAGSGSSSGSTGGTSSAQLRKYTDCVAQAGSDAAKAQRCADLLKSP